MIASPVGNIIHVWILDFGFWILDVNKNVSYRIPSKLAPYIYQYRVRTYTINTMYYCY